MAFVEFADVSKIYQMGEVEVAAVRDMSFTIERGEFVVIVGPSGAGKTTLLNMLGGMDSATSGTITLDGARVSSFNRKQLTQYRRHDIGFVFQFYNLVQNLTARENVELASQICRDPLDADEVLAAVGLADRVRQQVLGQDAFVGQVVKAFRRPFVMGTADTAHARGSMLLCGPTGTGRHYALTCIVDEMAGRGLLHSALIETMDLSLYPGPAQEKLFLQDLYAALQ
ncbi:MAG: ATP-binding cassette domain-containing protein, partial [Adlercreutzia sp.]|nr:ATP-binding cassette domain-containing protein [Adlercreutzia sp.]